MDLYGLYSKHPSGNFFSQLQLGYGVRGAAAGSLGSCALTTVPTTRHEHENTTSCLTETNMDWKNVYSKSAHDYSIETKQYLNLLLSFEYSCGYAAM